MWSALFGVFLGYCLQMHTLRGKLHLSGSQNEGDAQYETK